MHIFASKVVAGSGMISGMGASPAYVAVQSAEPSAWQQQHASADRLSVQVCAGIEVPAEVE